MMTGAYCCMKMLNFANIMREREFCMFKHQKEEVIHENIESYDVNDDIVTASDSGDDEEDIENDAEEDIVNDADKLNDFLKSLAS